MATANLYWGNNEFHEFWESEDHELLILRVHQEALWTAHRHHGFLFASDTAEEAANRLSAALCTNRVWKRNRENVFGLVQRSVA